MKMNQAWKKQDIKLRPGTRVTGKWHQKSYVIRKKLGSGAIGSVYLCETAEGRLAALKISDQGTSMTVEVNVLKSLQRVQGKRLGPYLLDVDDWKSPLGVTYSFYVMEYLQGEAMNTFIKNHGKEWIGVFMLQLLEDLDKLHQTGWVFGDLKPENLLVISSPVRVRWIDVGGTTQIGRAIKEYTEFYDRGYWGMGTRKAEPSYDLFSFVMVFLQAYYPNRFDKGSDPEKTLLKKLDAAKDLKAYRMPLKKALKGIYPSAAAMKRDMMSILQQMQRQTRSARKRKHTSQKVIASTPFFAEAGGIIFVSVGYYLFSLLF